MRSRHIHLALVAVVLASPLVAVGGGDKKKAASEADEIDYVALAARLVRDGHYDRAALTLEKVSEDDDEVDRNRLFVLRGIVSLKKKLYLDAAENFEKAIAEGNDEPLLLVNLGRARFGLKHYRRAADALERAKDAGENDPGAAMLKSRAYWESAAPGKALDVLGRALVRFPENTDFARLEIVYLVKLELFQELIKRRDLLLSRSEAKETDVAMIGEALRQAGKLEDAARTLETGRLRFPESIKLTVALARTLASQEKPLSAAMVLEHAARFDAKYRVETAELYRRAGRLERALFINQRISDQKEKMKQRLQLLLESERFEMIVAMEARLARLGLLADDQIRYALAYGFFENRDFDAAERHLSNITDRDLFKKGIELRKAIESCKGAGWECL